MLTQFNNLMGIVFLAQIRLKQGRMKTLLKRISITNLTRVRMEIIQMIIHNFQRFKLMLIMITIIKVREKSQVTRDHRHLINSIEEILTSHQLRAL